MDTKSSSIDFSPLIIGTMRLGVWGADLATADLQKFIEECLALGLNDFDHADIYGHYTEEGRFGKVLKANPSLRQKMQITTKCGIRLVCPERPSHSLKSYDSAKAHIIASAEHSLRELGTDYLDLLLIHRPDYLMNPHEIAAAFEQLKKQGKVRFFGVSNFTAPQMEMLASFTPLANNQVEISVLKLDAYTDATLDKCWQLRIRPTAWSPLGGGLVFGETTDARVVRVKEAAAKIAQAHGATIDQVLLAFVLKHPIGIVPVLGTSKIERIKTALGALDMDLTKEGWYALWQASIGGEVA